MIGDIILLFAIFMLWIFPTICSLLEFCIEMSGSKPHVEYPVAVMCFLFILIPPFNYIWPVERIKKCWESTH